MKRQTGGKQSAAVGQRSAELPAHRVGVEPEARLAWAVAFAQRESERMTAGDWDNALRELAVYLGPWLVTASEALAMKGTLGFALGGPHWRAHYLGEKALRRLDLRPAQDVQRILADALPRALAHERLDLPARASSAVWLGEIGRYVRVTSQAPVSELALRAFVDDLERAGERLRVCPAPRGRAATPCGRAFVQTRPQQAYCSPQCQSRAATRAYRAAQDKPSRRRTARRKEPA